MSRLEAAPREDAEPVHLDEARRHPQLCVGVERRVETLHVADLKDTLPLASHSNERVGLLDRRGDGFLDEHVAARLEQRARHLPM